MSEQVLHIETRIMCSVSMTMSINIALKARVITVILKQSQRIALLSTDCIDMLINIIYLFIFMQVLYSYTGVEVALIMRILLLYCCQ